MIKTVQHLHLILFVLIFSMTSSALEVSFEGVAEGLFDNREYPEIASPSQTVYGIRPTAAFRIHLDSSHSFALGAHYFFQFGQESGKGIVSPIVNYRYDSKSHQLLFGTTLRNELITIPEALISLLYDYDNPILQGTWYRFTTSLSESSLWLDWVGMRSATQREEFILGAQHSFRGTKGLLLSTDFIYNHVANVSGSTGNVQDHGGWTLTGGWEWNNFTRIQKVDAQLTSLLEFSRDRQLTMSYATPWGLSASAEILFQRFGFRYEHFHHISGATKNGIIPIGDPIYTEAYFDKIDALFMPLGHQESPVDIEFELSFIVTGGGLNHQEKLSINVPFKHLFGKKNHEQE